MIDEHSSPIFIQAMWRGCSTYFWLKFREVPSFRCYYEPLHERLLGLGPNDFSAEGRLKAFLRHPPNASNYFAEYERQPQGGVRLFRKRFSLERFYLAADAEDRELRTYIDGLLQSAFERGLRPMLQPNRAILRGEWMKRNFAGHHIYLNRDFASLAASYRSFGGPGRNYFWNCFAMIFGQNANDPLFRDMAELKKLRPCPDWDFARQLNHFGSATAAWRDRDFSDLAGFVWMAALAQASRYADTVIETSLMSDSDYRHDVAASLSSVVGSDMVLSDFQSVAAGPPDASRLSDDARIVIRRAVDQLKPNWDRLDAFGIADPTRQFVDKCLSRG